MQLEEAYTVETAKLSEHVDSTEHPVIQIVRMHQHNINSAVLQTASYVETELQRGTRKIMDNIAEKPKERWQGKRMYGQLPHSLDKELVDNEQCY
jgi:hypothetical protein